MRVLVVGSGGREHALAWALAASPLLSKLFIAPGNPGTAELGENVPIGILDIAALVAFARAQKIDLVLPGPEAPLVAGIADAMAAAGIRCCGPSKAAARLEGSKSFTKEMAEAAGIATARWERFDEPEAAREFVRRRGAPVVVKADGLAGGKGVVVAETEAGRARGGRRVHGGGHARRGRADRRDRGAAGRRGGIGLRAVRRDGCGVPRGGAGPQARGRGRYRAEHRRHGRDLAPRRPAADARRRGDGGGDPPGARGDGAARDAVPGVSLCRADADGIRDRR